MSADTRSRRGRVVTLTANPSLDRTLDPARPARARRGRAPGRQHHRARRQGRQRGPRGRRRRRRRRLGAARPPTTTRSSGAARARPAAGHRAGARPGAHQLHADRARRHDDEAQRARRRRSTTPPAPRSTAALHEHAAGARWVVLSGSLPPGTPVDWYAELVAVAARHRRPDRRRHLARRRCSPCSRPARARRRTCSSPTPRSSPSSPASPRRTCSRDPRRHAGRGAARCTTAASPRCCSPSAATAPCSPPPTAGSGRRCRRAITVRSTVGAGDSSLAGYLLADLAGAPPAERLRTAVAYGAASASLPGSAVPTPAQVDGSAVRVTAGAPSRRAQPAVAHVPPRPGRRPGCPLTPPEEVPMPALITPDLVALDADLGADKSAVVRRLAELVAAAGRATDADAPARRRHGPRGAGAHRPARRHRHPALPLGGGHPGLARLRPAVAEGRLRRPGRPGRPRLPHRRAGPGRRRPPHPADRAGPRAGAAGVRGLAARRAPRPRRSSRLVQDVVSPARRARPRRGRGSGRAAPAAAPGGRAARASSWSAPARPASRTPTWPPTSSPPPARPRASTCTSRPRARRAPPRSTRPSSAPPTR